MVEPEALWVRRTDSWVGPSAVASRHAEQASRIGSWERSKRFLLWMGAAWLRLAEWLGWRQGRGLAVSAPAGASLAASVPAEETAAAAPRASEPSVAVVPKPVIELRSHPLLDLEPVCLVSHPLEDLETEELTSDDDEAEEVLCPPGALAFTYDRCIAASLADIQAIILDPEMGPCWVDRCIECRLLEATATGMILYHRYRALGVKDRDSVSRARVRRLDGNAICIEMDRTEHAAAPQRGDAVRIPSLQGAFILRPLVDGSTHVHYTLEVELGGCIRGFLRRLVRRLQHSVPRKSLDRVAYLTSVN